MEGRKGGREGKREGERRVEGGFRQGAGDARWKVGGGKAIGSEEKGERERKGVGGKAKDRKKERESGGGG